MGHRVGSIRGRLAGLVGGRLTKLGGAGGSTERGFLTRVGSVGWLKITHSGW